MSYHAYPATAVANTRVATTSYVPHAALTMGGVGAIVGGTGAAARNIRQVKSGEINRQEAMGNVIKEAAGAGVATATATAVVGSFGTNRGLLSLLGLVVVATGTKYFWDAITESDKK
ncbi:magnetosome protein MamC [Desulfonema magnum]|uniref:Uncharacterized protein n=1 Tax=Desulfonema magnum TaxID=45655 RepID=A0A975GMK6_9BACT|nr:magnetosome protein MamC [Desulfonema magnum]QTA86996.1 Uncharacterized protein dnm_030230 [Desulfonema magnum]